MRILHILDRLSGAGPTRAIISLAKCQRHLGMEHQHHIAALSRECYPPALLMAARAGIPVSRQPDPQELRDQISNADIVQVSFWNSPTLNTFLRAEWPAARVLLWLKVLGTEPPQVVTPDLIGFGDLTAATSALTLDLPGMESVRARMRWIPSRFDIDRVRDCVARPHEGFCITYIGTTSFGKLHPSFIAMSMSARIPNSRFLVCGAGGDETLRRQAAEAGAADRLVFRGFVEDVRGILEISDVFGYPLCENSSATSEIALQEAMYAGVAPVVFPHAGVKELVRNGNTGLVVTSETEYTQALEYLYYHPEERERLGRNAHEFALANFLQDGPAREMDSIYRDLMTCPKRERRWPDAEGAIRPADRFAAAMGSAAPQFHASLEGSDPEAERSIARSSMLLASGEGGIFQFRNAYPDDPFLRFWTGLALLGQNRFSAAQRELQAAAELGITPERLQPWMAVARAEVCDW